MPKLTANFIQAKIKAPAKGQVDFYRDSELVGFGLMVRESSMTYFVEKRVNGKNRRVTIGKHPLLTPDKARNDAMGILASMAQGQDPTKMRDIRKTVSLTLAEAFAEYLESKKFRLNTVLSYKRAINQTLAGWQNKPITSITKNMVEERFKELSSGSMTGTSGKANANVTMTILRAVLNYASLKYEIDGEPLLAANPVSRLTQARSWHRLPKRQGVIPDHKLASWAKEFRTGKSNRERLLLCPSV